MYANNYPTPKPNNRYEVRDMSEVPATSETCLPIESVDSGNSNLKKSMSGCARAVRRKTKVEKRNEGLGFC